MQIKLVTDKALDWAMEHANDHLQCSQLSCGGSGLGVGQEGFMAGAKWAIEYLSDMFSDERCIDHERDGLCISGRIRKILEETVEMKR